MSPEHRHKINQFSFGCFGSFKMIKWNILHMSAVTFSEFGEGRGHGGGRAGCEAEDIERLQQGFLAGWTSADPGVGGQGAQGHLLRGLQPPFDFVIGDEVLP